MTPVLAARQAMGTRFELVLHGEDPVRLRAAADEALDEVDRIENLLSLYRPHTDIARVNSRAVEVPVRVTPETFRLLERARELTALTDGAFDITAGPLIRAWGFTDGTGTVPDPAVLDAARACVGWCWVELDSRDNTVRFLKPGVSLDLGGIGKGYALERTAALVRDAGITSALLHGGTSTVVAVGSPPNAEVWEVLLASPSAGADIFPRRKISLRDEALSVSAPWGKSFASPSGRRVGHVLDPRQGGPVYHWATAAAALPSATESDALSTALLVIGDAMTDRFRQAFPAARLWFEV